MQHWEEGSSDHTASSSHLVTDTKPVSRERCLRVCREWPRSYTRHCSDALFSAQDFLALSLLNDVLLPEWQDYAFTQLESQVEIPYDCLESKWNAPRLT
jgi:hypothetical protein